METIKNLRAFEIKHLWATNNKPFRIKIIDLKAKDFWINKSIILNKDYKYNNPYEQAIDFLNKKGIYIKYKAGNLLLSENNDIDLI